MTSGSTSLNSPSEQSSKRSLARTARCPSRRCHRKAGLGLGKLEQIAPLLAAADLFILPSQTESFGLSALEALASGVPCVVSNLPGVREPITAGETYHHIHQFQALMENRAVDNAMVDQDMGLSGQRLRRCEAPRMMSSRSIRATRTGNSCRSGWCGPSARGTSPRCRPHIAAEGPDVLPSPVYGRGLGRGSDGGGDRSTDSDSRCRAGSGTSPIRLYCAIWASRWDIRCSDTTPACAAWPSSKRITSASRRTSPMPETCNGTLRDACVYPGAATQCRAAGCADGVEYQADTIILGATSRLAHSTLPQGARS